MRTYAADRHNGDVSGQGIKSSHRRFRWATLTLVVAGVGFGMAVLAGVTPAMSFTLEVATGAPVTNQNGKTIHENIVVTSTGQAVYWLTGDSQRHPECTQANGCFKFWVPVKVASRGQLSKEPGISGSLGVWNRNGFLQVTLAGHPLYTFVLDHNKRAATGQGVRSFGGTWYVRQASPGSTSTTTMTSTSTTMTTTTTTSTSTTSTTTTSSSTTPYWG